jgi:hypothetical protein
LTWRVPGTASYFPSVRYRAHGSMYDTGSWTYQIMAYDLDTNDASLTNACAFAPDPLRRWTTDDLTVGAEGPRGRRSGTGSLPEPCFGNVPRR